MRKAHGWGLLFIAIVGMLIALLWLVGPEAQEADLFIPIRFEKLPPKLTFSPPADSGLDLLVRGNRSGLDAIAKTPPSYVVDLSGATVGVAQYPIRMAAIELPKGVHAVRVHPTVITLKIDEKISKELPVTPSFEGDVLTGYRVSRISATPPYLTVSGPSHLIESMTALSTKPFALANASESFRKEVSLDLPEQVSVDPDAKVITLHITIEEIIVIRTFKHIAVKWRNAEGDVRVSPQTIDLDIKGTGKTLARLEAENPIEVVLDLKGLQPGVYLRRAVIDLPVGTTLAGVTPALFSVTITGK